MIRQKFYHSMNGLLLYSSPTPITEENSSVIAQQDETVILQDENNDNSVKQAKY